MLIRLKLVIGDTLRCEDTLSLTLTVKKENEAECDVKRSDAAWSRSY